MALVSSFAKSPKARFSVSPLILALTIVTSAFACSSKTRDSDPSKNSADDKPAQRVFKPMEPLPIGEVLQGIADDQSYGVYRGNHNLYVNGQIITQGTSSLSPYPRSYEADEFDNTVTADEIASWNKKYNEQQTLLATNLEAALKASSCAFKNGDIAKTFPEFPPEWISEPVALGMLVSEAEFVKRMSCLGTFTSEDVSLKAADPLLLKLNKALLPVFSPD